MGDYEFWPVFVLAGILNQRKYYNFIAIVYARVLCNQPFEIAVLFIFSILLMKLLLK